LSWLLVAKKKKPLRLPLPPHRLLSSLLQPPHRLKLRLLLPMPTLPRQRPQPSRQPPKRKSSNHFSLPRSHLLETGGFFCGWNDVMCPWE